jgi:cyclophilin family peptidyl-prolyl cis-trans isomerase
MSVTRGRAAGALVLLVLAATRPAAGTRGQVPPVITPDTVYLAGERLIVDRTYPQTDVPASILTDRQILAAAEISLNPDVREAAVRVLGRFESPADIERIGSHNGDPNNDVRMATANALAQALINAKQETDARAIGMTFDLLRARLYGERVALVAGAILAAIGELPLTDVQAKEAERVLVERTSTAATLAFAAAGLEALLRHNPGRPIAAATRARLRQMSVRRFGSEGDTEPSLAALRALHAIHDTDVRTIASAAVYHCPPRADPECGWEIRRTGVLMTIGAPDRFSEQLNRALDDVHPLVRIAALRALASAIPESRYCGNLIGALGDPFRPVVLAAIDLMDPRCNDRQDVIDRLLPMAKELANPDRKAEWHAPVHAFVTMTRFVPEEIRSIAKETAAVHDVWQVRAAAAQIAATLRDESLALLLTEDKDPNVRTAALGALVQLGSAERVRVAIKALSTDDEQLVWYGAAVLRRSALASLGGSDVAHALIKEGVKTLRRLTEAGRETSRECRVELLARIGEYGTPGDTDLETALLPYLKDFDPFVAAAAADALKTLTGSRPTPQPARRPLDQPTEGEIQTFRKMRPPQVDIILADESHIGIHLLLNDAPVAATRFAKLAQSGYYSGLTFHYVDPEALIAGGSPRANDHAGDARFWRDEIGLSFRFPGEVGQVGLWTRGRHQGLGQFFVTLADMPGFDREHTIFGRACAPLKVLEGAVIREMKVNVQPIGPACK